MRAARLGIGRWRVALAAMFASAAATMVLISPFAWPALVIAVAAAGVWLGPRAYDPDTEASHANLTADADGVTFGALRVPVARIRSARVRPHENYGDLDLRLEKYLPPLRLRVQSADDAREIVKTLRLDARHVRDRFQLRAAAHRSALLAVVVVLISLVLNRVVVKLGALESLLAIAALFVAMFIDSRTRYLDIGPDGIRVRTLFRATHVPTHQLRGLVVGDTQQWTTKLELTRRGASPLTFYMYEGHVGPLRTRLDELRDESGEPPTSATIAKLLADKSLTELRTLRARPETFREFGLDRDGLLRIVEDASAAPALRARAAIALASDETMRTRIRTVAEQSTLPRLRVALEQAGADDATIEAALSALEHDAHS